MPERILAAAIELTTTAGWARVTMPALAAEVGVSRQTIYNEFGNRSRLAQAMVLQQLQVFLSVVDRAFATHTPDAIAAIRAATASVLDLAGSHGLLRAIVSAEHGANTELLPLLTSHGTGVQSAATETVRARLAECLPQAEGLDRVAAVIVRLVLSNVTQPAAGAEEVAAEVAWVAECLLQGAGAITGSPSRARRSVVQGQVRLPPHHTSAPANPMAVVRTPTSGRA